MEAVNKEEALYIIVYFSELMTATEKLALRHQQSTVKLDGSTNENLTKVYYRKGWLSDDPEVLNLLSEGPDQFMIDCTERILKESGDKVFLNLCPVCKKLARTPKAKQCRFCGYDWH
jgi:hypothetical protein